jgi:hypothetical protein
MDFHGEKRSKETHESKTDPDAKLARKGKGKEAKLSAEVALGFFLTSSIVKPFSAKLLNEMEELTKKTVIVKSDPALHQEQFDIH